MFLEDSRTSFGIGEGWTDRCLLLLMSKVMAFHKAVKLKFCEVNFLGGDSVK